jgi:hypothetical protein
MTSEFEQNKNYSPKIPRLLYPHINIKKQWKEINFIYCLNVRIADYRQSNDKSYDSHISSVLNFLKSVKNAEQIVGRETIDKSFFKNAWRRNQSENSLFWDIKFIAAEEKQEQDKFLRNVI